MKPEQEKQTATALSDAIHDLASRIPREIKIMEVCGTHTMSIHAAGLKKLFPPNLNLVSGPGCPVCVTEKSFIDEAILIARKYDVVIATFGDLVRVPGDEGSLAEFRAEGGAVKVVYSPLDAIAIAKECAPTPVVFLGVGFETTIPTVAATVKTARLQGINNLYVLTAFKTIHPPLKTLADKPDLDGFLLPGHVAAILGSNCFDYLVKDFHKPGVVAGFEALDILIAVRDLVSMLAENKPAIANDYKRVVRDAGNPVARALMEEVFSPCVAQWRGLGVIPGSGLEFRHKYNDFDAAKLFAVGTPQSKDDPRCRCAAIITGSKTPAHCGLFGKECTPEYPVGPCMVSSEGTCAAYYKYGGA